MTEQQKSVAMSLRLDPDVSEGIDLRLQDLLATHGIKMSRNQWINHCSRWALHNLPYGADKATKIAACLVAPDEVKGTTKYEMGLEAVEQKGSVK